MLNDREREMLMAIVCYDGADLYYASYGQGEPLLLLHGNGEDSSYFGGQIPELEKQYQVIVMDTRGHGRSGRGEGPLDFTRFARDAAAVLEALGLPCAHILGFSDGGNIAIRLALDFPERVRSLILNGANLDPSGIKWTVQTPILLGYGLCRMIGLRDAGARKKADILGLMVHHPHVRPSELSAIHVPTLVIAGEHDMVRQSHTELIAASIPHARLRIIPGGSHAVAAQKPAVFNREVLHFLQGTV